MMFSTGVELARTEQVDLFDNHCKNLHEQDSLPFILGGITAHTPIPILSGGGGVPGRGRNGIVPDLGLGERGHQPNLRWRPSSWPILPQVGHSTMILPTCPIAS